MIKDGLTALMHEGAARCYEEAVPMRFSSFVVWNVVSGRVAGEAV